MFFLILLCQVGLQGVLISWQLLLNEVRFKAFFVLSKPLSVLLLLDHLKILSAHWAPWILFCVLLDAKVAEFMLTRVQYPLLQNIFLADWTSNFKLSLSSGSDCPLGWNYTIVNFFLLCSLFLLLFDFNCLRCGEYKLVLLTILLSI